MTHAVCLTGVICMDTKKIEWTESDNVNCALLPRTIVSTSHVSAAVA